MNILQIERGIALVLYYYQVHFYFFDSLAFENAAIKIYSIKHFF